jgi:hypothetical protein
MKFFPTGNLFFCTNKFFFFKQWKWPPWVMNLIHLRMQYTTPNALILFHLGAHHAENPKIRFQENASSTQIFITERLGPILYLYFQLTYNVDGSRSSYCYLKPHCIQSSRVVVPAGTSKSTLRRHGIQAVTRVMAYIANAVTLWRCLQQCVLAASR